MKKATKFSFFFLLIAFILVIHQDLRAQWTTIPSTNNINYSTGSVLIGGTSFVSGFGATDRVLELHADSFSMFALQSGLSTNTSTLQFYCSTGFGSSITSGKNGTGVYQPFGIDVAGGNRMKFLTNGQITMGPGLCSTPMPADGLLGVGR